MRISMQVLAYVIAIIAVLLFGTVGTYIISNEYNGFNVRINSVISALFFTVVTISTVGYGDIYPVTKLAQIFVIILIIAGLSVFLSAIAVISGEFMNERISKIEGRLSSFEKRFLKNHVVLIGTDTINMHIAEKLKEKNERFIIVTSDKVTADHLNFQGYKAYVVDATSDSDMKEFALDKAKAIVIDMRDGSRAVYSLLLVRDLAKSQKVIVIAPNAEAEHHLKNIAAKGTVIVNPSELAAKVVSDNLFRQG